MGCGFLWLSECATDPPLDIINNIQTNLVPESPINGPVVLTDHHVFLWTLVSLLVLMVALLVICTCRYFGFCLTKKERRKNEDKARAADVELDRLKKQTVGSFVFKTDTGDSLPSYISTSNETEPEQSIYPTTSKGNGKKGAKGVT